ncbi:MAG TPA: vitamin K epoxide reductase family protein [Terriglobales bacterium]|nr:vitamin K epoxide reductase family protein [Terriglobales bacterium]
MAVVISVLAVIGIGLSVVSLVNHYKTTPSEFCDIDETFNCDIVNRSVYSKFLGVPVAAIGLAGYILLLVLSRINREKRLPSAILILGSLVGLGFSIYLTYVEARILAVYCILCLASLACIVLITTLSIVRHVRTRELVF